MVSGDSGDPDDPNPNMLHHFIVSDSNNNNNRRGHFALSQSFGLWERQESESRHLMDLVGAANDDQTQRLSLSLGSHMTHLFSDGVQVQVQHIGADDYTFAASNSLLHHQRSCCSYGPQFLGSSAIGNSRYLIPTQSLLDELVNMNVEAAAEEHFFASTSTLSSQLRAQLCTNPQKHDFQITLAKLIGLLEEVEVRYEKYYQQMQQLVSSFESVAGVGAAMSYTALALQAMSRHFGSLRNAILSQINVIIRRNLSNHHDLPIIIDKGLSQLSLIDNRDANKQNRLSSLQQLGMIPNSQRQAWRPIRGLPETSVAILRSWLFEHFLHPYPTDSEKLMLASQTCLTKNQVSNWFINARVRLWKPMIEEMYRQEFADSPHDSDPSLATTTSMGREAATDQAED